MDDKGRITLISSGDSVLPFEMKYEAGGRTWYHKTLTKAQGNAVIAIAENMDSVWVHHNHIIGTREGWVITGHRTDTGAIVNLVAAFTKEYWED